MFQGACKKFMPASLELGYNPIHRLPKKCSRSKMMDILTENLMLPRQTSFQLEGFLLRTSGKGKLNAPLSSTLRCQQHFSLGRIKRRCIVYDFFRKYTTLELALDVLMQSLDLLLYLGM
ncbi:hypothetical protein PHET_06659 [Paragonimus heterotremus]|uniref:Uncharacterized protein n=1 Tax=Paragonimus heterotremus TaxID=100268 RepID=A0A8J4WGT1_9TREM|nr:hypothetical protein PHET_06659 [Paragonimus heterotremus]